MSEQLGSYLSVGIKFFFLFTPFFALSVFLSLTEGYTEARRRRLALVVTAAVAVLCLLLFFAGPQLFALFGITLDSFRVGAGALLFLSAVGLVQGNPALSGTNPDGDVAIVPLAVPIVVGPATTGTLMVLGAESEGLAAKGFGSLALLLAVACLAVVLLLSSAIQRTVGIRGIGILSKLTGLVLAAMAAQMILTGIQSFMAG